MVRILSIKINERRKYRHAPGFTIVELLIIIIVIGILATLVLVSYGSIQKQARNTSRIATAASVRELIDAFIQVNGRYPDDGGEYGCIGQGFPEGKCWGIDSASPNYESQSASLNSDLATIGQLGAIGYPPVDMGIWHGIGPVLHRYTPTQSDPVRKVDGQVRPLILIYFLEGLNEDCGMNNIVQPVPAAPAGTIVRDNSSVYTFDTTKPRNSMYGGNGTYCIVSLDPL